MADRVRWGILGTGQIAKLFATGLQTLPDAELYAIASRSSEKAERFARQFHFSRHYFAYQDLIDDPAVEVVYVATPHSCHYENSLAALNSGKAVLCEKPFAINARQAAEVIALAREKRLFLMEAMWTRFFPLMETLREILRNQALGELRLLTADFGFRAKADVPADGRLFNPAYGGGALLDVGVYPVSLASMVCGPPVAISALAHLGHTGVDEQIGVVLKHSGGQLALLSAAIRTDTPQEAVFMGAAGRLRITSPWWRPSEMRLSRNDDKEELISRPFAGNGYHYQAKEVMQGLRTSKTESEVMPLDETLTIMRTLDAVREQIGLSYPME